MRKIWNNPQTLSQRAATAAKALRSRSVAPMQVAVLAVASAVLVACSGSDDKNASAAQSAQAPEVPVGVVVAKKENVDLIADLPGRVEAVRVAQVRARAAGILLKRHFVEGSDVKAGQLLFTIDPAPYKAALQSAKANLASAQATMAQNKAIVERYRPLVAVNAVSQLEFDNADASYKTAQAAVAAAQAEVRTAEINLGYASVTSPISGRIGRALVTEGALVGQGDATELAVVQQINPVYVNFTQSSAEVMELRKAIAQGQLHKVDGQEAVEVHVVLEDGTPYGEPGKLLFTDLTVDATTGQVTLRAEFPNPQGYLLPGMYVRVKLAQAQVANAIAIPQQAVSRGGINGDTVTVVDDEGNRRIVNVKVGEEAGGGRWLITSGLNEGDQVMVDGFQLLQMMPPNTKVKPQPWKQGEPTMPPPPTAGAAQGESADAGAK